jgi:hypothetical protein
VILTATLSPYASNGHTTNGETISFYDNSLLLGTATLSSGVATLTTINIHTNTTTLKAVYEGDTTFTGSSATLGFTDSPPPQTFTTLQLTVSPSQPEKVGQIVTLSATLTPWSANGYTTNRETVNFFSGPFFLGSATVISGVAIFSRPATEGVPPVTPVYAVYAGDGRFRGATSPPANYTSGLTP